ncbi:MAG: hypothetical protein KBC48_02980 [Candidatus Pacebacteria bacterium]|nr:hypothetical protein [Candidatus Paceibacterota bacterium]MBP9856234.1 hypothetical protein [Candidatus Paceibacterota bacterium]
MPYLSPYIETLRHKPEALKQKVSFLLALAITFIIFFVWLSAWQTGSVAVERETTGPVVSAGSALEREWTRVKLGASSLFNLFERRVIVK